MSLSLFDHLTIPTFAKVTKISRAGAFAGLAICSLREKFQEHQHVVHGVRARANEGGDMLRRLGVEEMHLTRLRIVHRC